MEILIGNYKYNPKKKIHYKMINSTIFFLSYYPSIIENTEKTDYIESYLSGFIIDFNVKKNLDFGIKSAVVKIGEKINTSSINVGEINKYKINLNNIFVLKSDIIDKTKPDIFFKTNSIQDEKLYYNLDNKKEYLNNINSFINSLKYFQVMCENFNVNDDVENYLINDLLQFKVKNILTKEEIIDYKNTYIALKLIIGINNNFLNAYKKTNSYFKMIEKIYKEKYLINREKYGLGLKLLEENEDLINNKNYLDEPKFKKLVSNFEKFGNEILFDAKDDNKVKEFKG